MVPLFNAAAHDASAAADIDRDGEVHASRSWRRCIQTHVRHLCIRGAFEPDSEAGLIELSVRAHSGAVLTREVALLAAEQTDQLTFQNPVTRYEAISPPVQDQPEPGLDQDLTPQADRGEHSYRGTGRLTGRKALITGADSGIGAAVAIAFAREGADVALSYLPEEEVDALEIKEFIESSGRRGVLIPGDLTDREFCTTVVERARAELGGLDILVNNAGRQIAVEEIGDLTDEQWTTTFETNIHAIYRVCKAAVPYLQPGSTIINTTSIQAYKPSPTLLDYAATKAAINNFSKGLSQQLAPKGIRVNAVAPGPVWTVLQVSDGQPKEKLPEFGKNTPLGRAGQPTEVAPAFVFLASPESSFVIGETLNVNGGQPSP